VDGAEEAVKPEPEGSEAPKTSSLVAAQNINGETLQGEAQAMAALATEATIIDPLTILKDEDPPELSSNGVPKVLKSYLIHRDPKIYVIPHFVSDEEIDHLMKLSEEHWIPSVVGSGYYKTNDESKDLTNKQSQNRTSYSCMLRTAQTQIVKSVELRLAAVADMDVDYLERLNLVRYSPGQFFNKHHDGRFRPKTIFLYLNDVPDGDAGETFFPELKLKIRPRKGCAIMWPNTVSLGVEDMRVVHLGLPPRTTTKYAINCFFNDKPLKQFEEHPEADGDNEDSYPTYDPDELVKNQTKDGASEKTAAITAFLLHSEPKISVVPNFLTANEASILVDCCDGEPIKDNDLFDRIEEKCAVLAGMPLEHMEPMKVSKCEVDMIPDGRMFAKGSYCTRFGIKTISLFLNEVPEGGHLRFPRLGFQVKPRMGTAVAWSAMDQQGNEDYKASHQGRAPRAGVRCAATCVFREKPVR